MNNDVLSMPESNIWSSVAEVQTGRLGFGVWVGCGVGAGYLSPMYLGSLPVIGQILSSIGQNISRADHGIAGGIGHRIGSSLSALKLPGGMSVGSGCGVGIGYGIGVGLMLKPGVFKGVVPAKVIGSLKSLNHGADDEADLHTDLGSSGKFEDRLRALESRISALEENLTK